jgi:mono/diheme cytochrome c family protein
LAVVAIILAGCLAVWARSTRDGVFTTEQATRGRTAYKEGCARCHSEDLQGSGSSPALAGKDFLKRWDGANVGELFTLIRKSMPSDDPGGMTAQQYSDLVAFILSTNAFPAGKTELGTDSASMADIKIESPK